MVVALFPCTDTVAPEIPGPDALFSCTTPLNEYVAANNADGKNIRTLNKTSIILNGILLFLMPAPLDFFRRNSNSTHHVIL